jgi:PAS domain S-box-containing protein
MSELQPTERSSRLERLIVLAGLLCALVIIGATLSHSLQLRDEMRRDAQDKVKTVSRILTQEVNRSLMRTRGLLEQVDELTGGSTAIASADFSARLDAMTRQHFLLREVAIVDRNGRIVASSNPRSTGLDVSGYDFSAAEARPRLFIGQPKAGRSFSRNASGLEGPAHAVDGFITVSRPLGNTPEGFLAVAVIGADSLIGDLRFMASMESEVLNLYRYDGKSLASSAAPDIQDALAHPIFRDFLPNRETGNFSHTTSDGKDWLAHFATTAEFPVVVEISLPQALVAARWYKELVAPLSILAATLIALFIFTRTAQQALRQRASSQEESASQAQRLRNILDSAADAIITVDVNSKVIEYNRAAEQVFRIPADEVIGQHASALLATGEAAGYQALVDYYLRTGMAPVFADGHKINTRRRDGSYMVLSYAISEVTIKDERLLTCIFRDITNEQQANERFRTLFQRSGQPTLLFSEGGLIDCNQAAVKLFGTTAKGALLGLQIEDLAVQEMNGLRLVDELDKVREIARKLGACRINWAASTLDGREVPLEITMTPIYLDNAEAMLLTCSDITERQRYEDGLRQARDAAEAAAKAKSRFLAVMSHELRTPMTGILGMIELLAETSLPTVQQRQVGILDKSANALMSVLNDILDYSKIETGRLELEQIDFDPAQIVREVIDALTHAANRRENTLQAQWGETPLPLLHGDPTRVKQVLFNLVGNAVKFTEQGSIVVHLAAQPARADGQVALCIEVRDTGIGIGSEVQQTLFQPFQQADTSTTRRFGGTGLGLAICRHLVDAMHGRISVESEVGKGSVFRVELELAQAKGQLASAPKRRASDAVARVCSLRILVAEDNPTNRLLIETRLRRAGHQLEMVEDGQQALVAASTEDFDLILMDMQMPVLDGMGATRAIRALPDARRNRVPIIALTADALPELRNEYMASGLDDYQTKPIDWAALDTAILRNLPWARMDAPTSIESPPMRDSVPTATTQTTSTMQDVEAIAVGEDHTPIDAAGVGRMREELGPDVWTAVADIYWPQGDTDLAACRAAVLAQDAAAQRSAAHSLKGASASLGFESIASLAAVLERCEPGVAASTLAQLETVCSRTRTDWSMATSVTD